MFRKRINKTTIVAAGLALSLFAGWAHAEVVIIANLKNPVSTLDAEDVKRIFLGKSKTFPGGKMAIAVDQHDDSPTKAAFINKLLQKDAAQLTSYWSTMIFSGKGRPPSVIGSDADVLAWIKNNPEGLGYVDAAAVDKSVKVLLRVP